MATRTIYLAVPDSGGGGGTRRGGILDRRSTSGGSRWWNALDRFDLRAEMRVPGQAWLQASAVSEGDGTRLIQTALFAPRGLFGPLYWYAMYPAHLFIFGDMARAVVHLARTEPVTAPVARTRVSFEPRL